MFINPASSSKSPRQSFRFQGRRQDLSPQDRTRASGRSSRSRRQSMRRPRNSASAEVAMERERPRSFRPQHEYFYEDEDGDNHSLIDLVRSTQGSRASLSVSSFLLPTNRNHRIEFNFQASGRRSKMSYGREEPEPRLHSQLSHYHRQQQNSSRNSRRYLK